MARVEKNFGKYLISLGYAKRSSIEAGKHLAKGYRFADEAFLEQNRKKYEKEARLYDRMLEEFKIAYTEVGVYREALNTKDYGTNSSGIKTILE